MAEVTLSKVVKHYGGLQVVHGVDLEVKSGEFLVLVGPSGCGKSTLLRMIAGLEEISDGTISIAGRVVNDVPASQRDLSMVFQSYALYPHMSVRKNLAFGLSNLRMPRPDIARRVAEAARILQIEELMERSRASSRAGRSSASPSAAPSCASRSCSCSTSRSPTSTPSCGCRCGSNSPTSTTGWERR